MQFMRDGGVFMWVMLVAALVSLGLAFARRDQNGWRIAAGGAVLVLGLGVIGYSLGVGSTMKFIGSWTGAEAEKLTILTVGLRESSNNTLFSGVLAVVMSIASFILAPKGQTS